MRIQIDDIEGSLEIDLFHSMSPNHRHHLGEDQRMKIISLDSVRYQLQSGRFLFLNLIVSDECTTNGSQIERNFRLLSMHFASLRRNFVAVSYSRRHLAIVKYNNNKLLRTI